MVHINPEKLQLLERVWNNAGDVEVDGVNVAQICGWASWVIFSALEDQERPPEPAVNPTPAPTPAPAPRDPPRPASSGYWDGRSG
jgi:hypothetical protein